MLSRWCLCKVQLHTKVIFTSLCDQSLLLSDIYILTKKICIPFPQIKVHGHPFLSERDRPSRSDVRVVSERKPRSSHLGHLKSHDSINPDLVRIKCLSSHLQRGVHRNQTHVRERVREHVHTCLRDSGAPYVPVCVLLHDPLFDHCSSVNPIHAEAITSQRTVRLQHVRSVNVNLPASILSSPGCFHVRRIYANPTLSSRRGRMTTTR